MSEYLFKGSVLLSAEPFTVKPVNLPFAADTENITYHPVVVDVVDNGEGRFSHRERAVTLKDKWEHMRVSYAAPAHDRQKLEALNDGDVIAHFPAAEGAEASEAYYRIYPAADFAAGVDSGAFAEVKKETKKK